MATARTIEIFLPDGEPNGVRVAHIRNRNIEATYIPRARLMTVKERQSLHGVGIYLLVGNSEQHSKPIIYIGEAENVFVRLKQHNASKDFWDYAIALTSNNLHLTKTHVKFLEWLCHNKAVLANRCILENSSVPTKSHTSESTEADLYDNFETIELLVSTLGLNIFLEFLEREFSSPNSLCEGQAVSDETPLKFVLRGRGAEAAGIYTQEGFLVYSGAKLAKELSESLMKDSPKIRERFVRDGIIYLKDNDWFLKETYLFSSPSFAATVITGTSQNGWTMWKLPDGQTLHDIYRKDVSTQ